MTADLEQRGIGDEEVQGQGGQGVSWDVRGGVQGRGAVARHRLRREPSVSEEQRRGWWTTVMGVRCNPSA